jgi:hypothetical protein
MNIVLEDAGVLKFFMLCIRNKTKSKILLASMKLLTNYVNPFSNSLHRPYSSCVYHGNALGSHMFAACDRSILAQFHGSQ